MIKRVTTIIFLLLANLILLAHIVVPHHHHGCAIFIIDTHYPLNAKADKQEQAEKGSNQESGCKKECKHVVVDQVIVFHANQLKIEFKGAGGFNGHQVLNGYIALLFDNLSYASGSGLLTNAYPPTLINSSYSHFVNTIAGLRAPPVV